MNNLATTKTFRHIVATMGLASICFGANVNAGEHDTGLTISPMVGKAFFEDSRGLDDEQFLSLAIGYEYGNHWAAELAYLTSEPDFTVGSASADLSQYRLDGLYHFMAGKFRPYVVAGVGSNSFETNLDDTDDTFVNLGLGAKYALNSVFSLRGDARLVQSVDESDTDYLVGIGAIFKFGKSSSTPAKAAPAKVVHVQDSDKDGVSDAADECPNSKPGASVNTLGCEIDNDLDKDGVVNAKDKCPSSSAGAKVDSTGCNLVLKENISVVLEVNFATNSDKVINNALNEVEKVAEFMRAYPDAKVVFEGYTDDRGAEDYNQKLSQRRADAVAKLLVDSFSINANRVSAVGYGEEKPLVENDTAENRAKNRRVVAVVNSTTEKVVQ